LFYTILRGQVPKDQLLFEIEIERVAKRNRKTKTKERQGDTREESSTSSFPTHNSLQKDTNMADEQAPPPRRTLGDYAMHQGPKIFSRIAIPAMNSALEMKLAFLTLISTHQFTTMDLEDPHTHLATFYELVGTMSFQSGDLENVYICLFPFSLACKAKEWLKSHPN